MTGSGRHDLHWVVLGSEPVTHADQITDLIQGYESIALGEVDTSAAEVAAMLADPEVDGEASGLVFAGDDLESLVGIRLVTVIPAERDVAVDCWVAPHLTDALQELVMAEVTRDMVPMAQALAAAAEPTRRSPMAVPTTSGADRGADKSVWQVVAGAYRQDVAWTQALQSHGLTRVRTFERLRLEHGLDVTAPQPPDGVEVRGVDGDADMRIFHRIHLAAFADHWGGEPERPFDDWLAWQRSHGGVREDLWRIAVADGEPVGICSGSDIRAEFGVAYIPLLGVLRSARGRGIARYLLHDQFVLSAARGFTTTELAVDATSETGADRLYRSVGMRPYRIMDFWLRTIG